METDVGSCTVNWYKNKAANSLIGSQNKSATTAGNHHSMIGVATNNINPNGADNYIVAKPTAVNNSTTSLRFRIDLQRDNSFKDKH